MIDMQLNLMSLMLCIVCVVVTEGASASADETQPSAIRIGVIGLDTSHAIAFTKELNQTAATENGLILRVVAAYPYGSRDIESSASRIPAMTQEMQQLGVDVVESVAELLKRVDCVLLETNDGKLHREQANEVFAAGKPVFIDKPVAASLTDVLAIYAAAEKHGVPMFSSSALRYGNNALAIRAGLVGKVLGCDAYSPCALESSHSDLFWYGIHGVETLFACMGPGCTSVSRSSSDDFDVVVGTWSDGRIATFRGIRSGASGYGGTVFGERGIVNIDKFAGYKPLVAVIAEFFRTMQPPVEAAETIEIYAFMEAAAESKRQGGIPITINAVMQHAKAHVNENGEGSR